MLVEDAASNNKTIINPSFLFKVTLKVILAKNAYFLDFRPDKHKFRSLCSIHPKMC